MFNLARSSQNSARKPKPKLDHSTGESRKENEIFVQSVAANSFFWRKVQLTVDLKAFPPTKSSKFEFSAPAAGKVEFKVCCVLLLTSCSSFKTFTV